jgi:predicted nucleotidyltransferase component of viral defense system
MKNIAASIRAKLMQIAKQENKSFQNIILRYFQERFLYRLSQSSSSSNFCLKGGALFYAWEGLSARPTKDIDLLGRNTSNSHENLLQIFNTIANIEFEADGVRFDEKSLITSEIVKEGNYQGVRVTLIAYLENIKEKVQVDIGFGDAVIPNPEFMTFPTLLDLDAPIILAYSPESVVAEKFHAMLDLGELNSRMKDFHDVHFLIKSGKLRTEFLEESILTTLRQRNFKSKTNISLFLPDFASNLKRQSMYLSFLEKANLSTTDTFEDVCNLIVRELKPIFRKM